MLRCTHKHIPYHLHIHRCSDTFIYTHMHTWMMTHMTHHWYTLHKQTARHILYTPRHITYAHADTDAQIHTTHVHDISIHTTINIHIYTSTINIHITHINMLIYTHTHMHLHMQTHPQETTDTCTPHTCIHILHRVLHIYATQYPTVIFTNILI